jgi:preprotein translocase subunit SecA
LRGRSGRQGDVGESRFYISLEDELIRRFGGDTFELRDRMQKYAGMTEDETIESTLVSRTIEHSQEKVEKQHFESRKNLLEYDDVMNQHRKVIYSWRRSVLEGEEQIYELVRDMIIDGVQDAFARFAPEHTASEEERILVLGFIARVIGVETTFFSQPAFTTTDTELLKTDVINLVLEQYSLYRKNSNQEILAEAEKWMMLETIDQAWKQHMLNLDHLQEGINLRSWGQKSPIIEYKREAFAMFQTMMQEIRWEVVHRIFHIQLDHFDSEHLEEKRERELGSIQIIVTDIEDEQPKRRDEPRVGRNESCSCGSGKKMKKCCN